MSVSLQIRNVPEEVRDRLAERAKLQGQSIQAYLLHLVEREARFSRNAETLERTRGIRKNIPAEFFDDVIREGREHGAEVDRGELA